MNIFKSTLDTRHQNGVIGPITQFDNATLELQILTGGQVTEPWDSPKFELMAMKRDMNPVREVEQDKFIILSKEDHKVRIDLKEQFLTCRGTVKMQLIIKDGGRLSTTIFRLSIGQSLDHSIIESLKDIKVLDDLNEVVESLTTLNTTAEDNEAKRQENERLREVAESNRQDEFEQAQNQRDTDFNEKMEEYQDYVSANEETRQKNEELRELAESNRQDEFSKAQSQRDTEFNNKMEEFQEHVSKLEGEKGEQGETPQIRVNETHIQVKYPSEQEWFDLIALEMLRGRQGLQGLQGEALQIQTNDTHIQFKYPSQQKWTDLIALESLRGLQGIQGEQGYSGVFIGKPEDAPASANLVIDDDMTDYELLIADANRDYMGNDHQTLRQAANANVDHAVRTAVGEFNYLAYEGQVIKATNTIEGHAKSAVLKGQTLVNLFTNLELNRIFNHTNTANVSVYGFFGRDGLTRNLEKGKTYFAVERWEITSRQSSTTNFPLEFQAKMVGVDGADTYISHKQDFRIGQYTVARKITTQKEYKAYHCCLINRAGDTISGKFLGCIIVEYQDGMENWDIPYFEGMSSVKNPIASSTGKNLISYLPSTVASGMTLTQTDVKSELAITGTCTASNYDYYFARSTPGAVVDTEVTRLLVNAPVGTKFVLSNNLGKECYFGVVRGGATSITWIAGNIGYEVKAGDTYVLAFVRFKQGDTCSGERLKIQLEISPSVTTYEAYNSHTHTVEGNLILRSLPNSVCDTLNLITGEYVQRINEITFSGLDGEPWSYSEMKGDNYRFSLTMTTEAAGTNDKTLMLCDKWTVGMLVNETIQEQIMIYNHGSHSELRLVISPTKLTSNTPQALKDYLKANPFTIQYELATPVIKKVKLSHDEVYSYNGLTNYSCQSEAEGSLIPTLAVTVPTNIQEVIQAERQKNIKLSEAQDVLIEYQLQMYEQTTPVALCTQEVPIFVRNLYELAYERGIRVREEVESDGNLY